MESAKSNDHIVRVARVPTAESGTYPVPYRMDARPEESGLPDPKESKDMQWTMRRVSKMLGVDTRRVSSIR